MESQGARWTDREPFRGTEFNCTVDGAQRWEYLIAFDTKEIIN